MSQATGTLLQMLKAMSERNLYSQGTIIGEKKCLFLVIFLEWLLAFRKSLGSLVSQATGTLLQMLKAMSERNLYSQGTIIGEKKCLFLVIFPRKMTQLGKG